MYALFVVQPTVLHIATEISEVHSKFGKRIFIVYLFRLQVHALRYSVAQFNSFGSKFQTTFIVCFFFFFFFFFFFCFNKLSLEKKFIYKVERMDVCKSLLPSPVAVKELKMLYFKDIVEYTRRIQCRWMLGWRAHDMSTYTSTIATRLHQIYYHLKIETYVLTSILAWLALALYYFNLTQNPRVPGLTTASPRNTKSTVPAVIFRAGKVVVGVQWHMFLCACTTFPSGQTQFLAYKISKDKT